jgi:hypothetical protein
MKMIQLGQIINPLIEIVPSRMVIRSSGMAPNRLFGGDGSFRMTRDSIHPLIDAARQRYRYAWRPKKARIRNESGATTHYR